MAPTFTRRPVSFALLLVIAWETAASAAPPTIQSGSNPYAAPINITRGGVYTGNYRSDDSTIPAITVSTGEPVEITGCNIVSAGTHIKAYGGTQLNIHHNTFTGATPTGNAQWGRVLDDFHPVTLVFEHNTVEHTGGLLVDHADAGTRSAAIRFNIFRNTDKRKADGTNGDHRAAILFNTVLPIAAEIAWNQFENLPGESHVEDNINLLNTGGTPASPILVHDNFVFGAYPYPLDAPHYTGSGITVEGDPTHNRFDNVSQHIRVFNNQIVSTCNGGLNVNAGHDIDVQFNTVISSGMFPDGTRSSLFWAGCGLWNGSNVSPNVFKDITFKNNTIGFYREGVSKPLPNRQDSAMGVDLAQNISLPNPITLETEQAQWDVWRRKLADNGHTVGNVLTPTR